jgi:hypothetical protein
MLSRSAPSILFQKEGDDNPQEHQENISPNVQVPLWKTLRDKCNIKKCDRVKYKPSHIYNPKIRRFST